MAGPGHLPKEVVEEIMSLLPADSLLRFKCVNKSWYGLIRSLVADPYFVARHLNNAKKKACTPSMGLRLNYENDGMQGFAWLTLLNENTGNDDHIFSSTDQLKLPLCPCEIECGAELIGDEEVYHCDGIILRVISGDSVVLCNPVLQEFDVFPGPRYDNKYLDFGPICGGFGYDSSTNAYKIVRVFHNESSGITRAKIFTLGTLFWREVHFPQDANEIYADGLYFSGVCYWAAGWSSDARKILCFDMCLEKFYVIPAPVTTRTPEECVDWLRLTEWNNSVACLHVCNFSSKNWSVEVFVMDGAPDKVKGACSWTKHLNIQLEIEIEDVLKFWKSDELLMLDSSMNLVSYNITTKKFGYFSIDGIDLVEFKTSHFWPVFYVKSLVSIKGR